MKQVFDPTNPGRIEGTTAVQIEGPIMTTTPGGDDVYPVYADLDDDGRILALRIDLGPHW